MENSRKKTNLKALVECAVMIALACVLSLFKIYEAPLGGSVTLFSMVPILIIGFRNGPAWGCGSAFVYSIIKLILGLSNFAYVPTARGVVLTVLFDYVLAFTVLGVVGFFKVDKISDKKKKVAAVILASLLACLLRYACSVVSGACVWYEITKEGAWNDYVFKVGMWTYSIVYNAQYMLPETILTVIAAPTVTMLLDIAGKKKN